MDWKYLQRLLKILVKQGITSIELITVAPLPNSVLVRCLDDASVMCSTKDSRYHMAPDKFPT